MALTTLEDKFVYDLKAMYYIETELVETIKELAADAADDKLEKGFSEHRAETREHVNRLEAVFNELGIEPEARASPVFDGLLEERREFLQQTDNQELRDLFDLEAGIKTERMEISGYEGLLNLAKKIGYDDDITDPLEDNLSSEKSTLRELEGLTKGSKMKSMISQLLS